jgi:hypothetical protein
MTWSGSSRPGSRLLVRLLRNRSRSPDAPLAAAGQLNRRQRIRGRRGHFQLE